MFLAPLPPREFLSCAGLSTNAVYQKRPPPSQGACPRAHLAPRIRDGCRCRLFYAESCRRRGGGGRVCAGGVLRRGVVPVWARSAARGDRAAVRAAGRDVAGGGALSPC